MSDGDSIDWEQKLKNKANSLVNKGKTTLMNFNKRSLWNKLLLMAALHYVLKFFMGDEEAAE
jgi:hypothetical protein